MEFFIRLKDGMPFEHPIAKDNLCAAFPNVDLNNLPPEFARFERVERPIPSVYEVLESDTPSYVVTDGVCRDVWHLRNMTDDEKAAKQQHVKDDWAKRLDIENFSAWVFDEMTCMYQPPTPYPDDGKRYFWQGTSLSWVERPAYPDDGKLYKLNYASATWEEEVTS